MRRYLPAIVPLLLLAAQSVSAAPTNLSGNSALALAALVGTQSRAVTLKERKALANMLDGRLAFPWPPNQKIFVNADKVMCRASNVDISAHSCELTFGTRTRALSGHTAHELYATLIESGVPLEGAAGSLLEGVTQLACTIDVAAVKQKGGGGADCTFAARP
jgi:hypothetical protein